MTREAFWESQAGHHPGIRGIGLVAVAGVAFGAATSMSNVFGSAYGPFTRTPGEGVVWLEFVSAWIGSAWAWALFAFVVGWLTAALVNSALRAVLGLVLAVIAYYACDVALGMDASPSYAEMVFWAALALIVGPIMAIAGTLARRPTWLGLLVGLAAPAVMVLDSVMRGSGPAHIRPWSEWVVLCAAGVLTLAVAYRAYGRGRRPGAGSHGIVVGTKPR